MSLKRYADHSSKWKVEKELDKTYATKDEARKGLDPVFGITLVDIRYIDGMRRYNERHA